MPRYGRSPWTDWFPKSRVPAPPRFRGRLDAEVVIIGGGLTGCATAYAFAAAGRPVVLLEADRLGRSGSAAATGWISDDPGVSFIEIETALGRRTARHAWQAWRRAALDFGTLVRRLRLKCDFEPRATLTLATSPEQAARLTRELRARRDAGFEASLLSSRAVTAEAGVPAAAGLRSRDGATLDPYRATIGLAAAAAKRGARLFERSAVTRTTFGRRWAEVRTEGGAIRTSRVIVATGSPTVLFKGLQRHFWFRSAFLALTSPIPAGVRKQLGRRASVVRDRATPPHLIRWVGDERLLVTGADAERPPARQREPVLVQRTGQLMYELSTLYPDISGLPPAYGWDLPYARTADGLPYIGPHRNYPHHLFAWGDVGHGITGAYLASRILLRHHTGAAEPADGSFGFHR
jgi:glycine/D-amino acid oxidase-like deaminating enzyme